MILVTGATGHIGNVLVKELLKEGEQVRALVLPSEDASELRESGVHVVIGNLLDFASLENAMRGVDAVFHLAGIISIMPNTFDLLKKVNVDGTINVLHAAREAGVKRLVYTASIHAFSRAWQGVIDESVPFDPNSACGDYDRSKAMAALAVLDAARGGMDALVVCPTGVIGPYDYRGSEMGEMLRAWSLPAAAHLMIDGAYDFVDVRDVARGHIQALRKGRAGEVYILSGERIEVPEIHRLVQRTAGLRAALIKIPYWLAKAASAFTPLYYRITRATPKFTPYSLETLRSNCVVSSRKAREELGFQARALAESIADTVRWWQKQTTPTIEP